jgi:hypothetical protein
MSSEISMAATTFAVFIFDGRGARTSQCLADPSFIQAALFGLVGEAVGKGFLHRAGDAFLRPVPCRRGSRNRRLWGKALVEFVIEAQQAVVAVLDRDQAGHPLEQVLVLIPLLVQLLLLEAMSSPIWLMAAANCPSSSFFFDLNLAGVIPPGDKAGAVDETLDGLVDEAQHKDKDDGCCDEKIRRRPGR